MSPELRAALYSAKPPMTHVEAIDYVEEMRAAKRMKDECRLSILKAGVRIGNLSPEAREVYRAEIARIEAKNNA